MHDEFYEATTDMPHQHCCGYVRHEIDALLDEVNVEQGCGFIWAHDPPERHEYTQDKVRDAHTCPNCGKGPWYCIFWKGREGIYGTQAAQHS